LTLGCRYISGRNKREQKIEMTTPVVVRCTPQIVDLEEDFDVEFFLPFAYQVGRGR
jgi:hypothetical protein